MIEVAPAGNFVAPPPPAPPVSELLHELDVALQVEAASRLATSAHLKAARLEFLKHKLLHQLIEQVGPTEPAFAADLQRFQAAHASQRLGLGSSSGVGNTAAAAPAAAAAAADSRSAEEAEAGSSSHCLGVRPPLSASLPGGGGQQPSSSSSAAIIDAIGAHLSTAAARWAVELRVGGPAAAAAAAGGGRPSQQSGLGSTLSETLPAAVAARRQALRSKRAAAPQQLFQLLSTAGRVLSQYAEMDASMVAFVEREVLVHQASLDTKNLAYDEAWVGLLQAKLRALEVQMEWQTYTPDHVKALARVHELITEQAGTTTQALGQVSAKLDAYQGLGPAFASVCASYGHARRQAADMQRTLANFEAVEAELEGSGEQSQH
ncbi:hypothetical protein FOA52_000560 [Chlamydomonas sp. UWO 241]|nr:hypothetical protein FOA52_000560 [Chlamydomonas sp. UWO 241]